MITKRLIKNWINFFKVFLKARWVLFPPKKIDFIVFDGINNPFLKFLKKKKYSIFYNRNEEINLFVLMFCIIKLKISKKEYIKKYFQFANPKIVLSAIDNSHTLLEIKDYLDIKIVSIQNGYRTYWGDLLDLEKKFQKRKKKFNLDVMFVFNEKIAKIYNKYIDGQKIVIGSYINNERKVKKYKKKNEAIFISTHKPRINLKIKEEGISMHDFFKGDVDVLKNISELCIKNNLNLTILARNKINQFYSKEFFYFQKILKNSFKIIKNKNGQNNHTILDKYKFVITIDSTLGSENLSRGGRSIFIFSRPKIFPAISRSYGYMEGLQIDGEYWCSSKKKISKVFYNLIKKNDLEWSRYRKNHKKILFYDPNNKIFKKEINKLL